HRGMYYYLYRPANQPSISNKSLDQLVNETLAGVHGNGDTRKASLGSQYEAVMAVINGKASASEKSDEELAREVLAGKHGAGEDRKRSLGPRYEPVQAKVNELLKAKEKPSEVVKN
ncbi:TPA: holin, partial [Streptococcus suis]|nr:holin [Streptococcus suis]